MRLTRHKGETETLGDTDWKKKKKGPTEAKERESETHTQKQRQSDRYKGRKERQECVYLRN